MDDWMGYMIRRMEARATQRIGELAAELVETPSEGKEAILAEMQYQRWLAESCQVCRGAR